MKKELIINTVAVLIALISVCVAVDRYSDKAAADERLANTPSRTEIEGLDAAAADAEQKLTAARRELEESRSRMETLTAELKDASANRDEQKKLHKEREQTRKDHLTKLDNLRRDNAAAEKRIAEAKAKAEAEAKAAAEKAAKEKEEAEAKAKAAAEAAKNKAKSSSSRRSGSTKKRRR